MISTSLDLKAGSLINVMIPRATPEESDKIYGEVSSGLIQKFHPFLAQYIDNEGLLKKIEACKSIEELEALRVDLIYPSLFRDLAEELDQNEQLSDSERIFILTYTADRMIKGAQDWFQACAQQRAQRIAATPPGSIITMDRDPHMKKNKKGRIIT